MRNTSRKVLGGLPGLLAVFALAAPAGAQGADPPGFAAVPVRGAQVIALNVVCFEHAVGDHAEALPCTGDMMLHDAAGRELKESSYRLLPGESTTLRLAVPAVDGNGVPVRRVMIIPCFLPGPGGLGIPSVEVFDRESGRVVLFAHPASPRMSAFADGISPGGGVAFDPQPEPPLFGMITMRGDQVMRLNATCFPHAVGDTAPSPCRGEIMFHDASGNVVRRAIYQIAPGEARSFAVALPDLRPGALGGIVPCFLPSPGGRAIPSVEVTNADGSTALLINPAAARASQFQVLTPR